MAPGTTPPNAGTTALGFIRALDLSESIAGQFCCRMLADYGADVTLVEPPQGSATRRMAPFRESAGAERQSLLFEHLNLSKNSLIIDRTTAAGRDLLRDLARNSDVVVVPAGFDRAALRGASPTCIIATVSPFGEGTPKSHWRGTEMIYQAMSGMMTHNGRHDREPLYGVGNRASYCAGIAAYSSILAALMVRERTGVAQDVAIDIAHVAASMTYPFALQYSYNGSFEERGMRGQPLVEVKCREGWIAIWIRANHFAIVCDVLGMPEMATDPRFAGDADRKANFQQFIAEVQKRVADRVGADIVKALQAKRVVAACCFKPSQLGPDAEHLKVRDFWHVMSTDAGPRLALGPQFRMSRTPRRAPTPAPSLGEARSTGVR
jgi:crotonobetainyl-CoA:carnitine CoA-transferase CaiB-like acyl-CoA transferase